MVFEDNTIENKTNGDYPFDPRWIFMCDDGVKFKKYKNKQAIDISNWTIWVNHMGLDSELTMYEYHHFITG